MHRVLEQNQKFFVLAGASGTLASELGALMGIVGAVGRTPPKGWGWGWAAFEGGLGRAGVGWLPCLFENGKVVPRPDKGDQQQQAISIYFFMEGLGLGFRV